MMAPVGAGAQGPASPRSTTRYYLLENYYLRHSTQVARIHDFLRDGLLPSASRIQDGAKIFLEAVVAAHMPQVAVILAFRSLEEIAALRGKLREDASFQKAFQAWENGPEPPYEHFSQTLLKATDYSPEIAAPARRADTARIFELRVYHSPTWKQLAALHQRFAGPEIKIFDRVGVHPLFYSETAIGTNMPNLTYLIPFENLAAREKAWDAFGADPEWLKVRAQSVEAHGQIASVIQMTLFKSAPYSPVS
jgi:hypothetical protein